MKQILRTVFFRRNFRRRIQFNPELCEIYYQQVELFLLGDAQATRPHKLKISMKGFKAFSITSEIRIIYKEESKYYIFVDIGTHEQVYWS